MPTSDPAAGDAGALDFLAVDRYLRTIVDARALKTALELGLIDALAAGGREAASLGASLGVDAAGMRLLIGLLTANGVVVERKGVVALHDGFVAALRYRDLLETKLDFAGFVLNDFADYFTALVQDPARFTGRAQLFQLFDYRRATEPSPENHQRTKAWMRLTSALTRYEAGALMGLHDFSRHRRMLDIGGNSGELLLQACRRHPALSGTVLDLPVVCDVGLEHVLPEPEAARIAFLKGDMRRDPVPAGYDLITFKSMLHDWPEDTAAQFLRKAAAALQPGGTLLIFERLPLEVAGATPPFSVLPLLLFFRSYRTPEAHAACLAALGFQDIAQRRIELDTPFYLLTATKPHA